MRAFGAAPPGLCLEPDAIDAAEADHLLAIVDAAPWSDALSRRVQHYGAVYDYRSGGARPPKRLGPLPGWLSALAERLAARGLFAAPPDQVIANEYLPGQGIAPHVDRLDHFGEAVASLSLCGACVMRFSHPETGATADLHLPPRSLLAMRGEARRVWRHGIAPRKTDPGKTDPGPSGRIPRARRVSLTFRTLRER